jgi:D-alanyl-D-alanine dipeptidase
LVDLARVVPGVLLDVRYSTARNFTAAPLPGYEAPGAWLTEGAATALEVAQRALHPDGVGLVVFDAYRPVRATQAMVAWCHEHGREELLRGYVSATSRHNRGIAIDVGLASLADRAPLDLGCDFDTFTEAAHTANASGAALELRLLLSRRMEEAGFTAYSREWWHFERPDAAAPSWDVPYAFAE